jgi:hypothetical protein
MVSEVNTGESARPCLLAEDALCAAKRKRALIERAYSRGSQSVGAVCEGNECEAGNSPPDTGGVAAPSRKRCEATAAAQTGWWGLTNRFKMRSLEKVPFSTTPSAPFKEASRLLLDVASTPPVSGGEWRTQFIHNFYHRVGFVMQCAESVQPRERRP